MTLIPFRWLRDMSTFVFGNPVIPREMKVRMRFKRAIWLQIAHILFLIIIVLLAYHLVIANEPISHPAGLQSKLQTFYHILLYSLAAIVILVAPALTASAISFEHERRTLDLLLMTPLHPMKILFGKLLASWSFLLLLLILSMPMIAVCIAVGGASIGDLLATFLMLSLGALNLCAFALYCSACSKSSGLATLWAYFGIIHASGFIFPLIGIQIDVQYTGSSSLQQVVLFPIVSVNPLGAPYIKAMPTRILGVNIPCWVFCSIFSLLLVRFWLTASLARLPIVHHKNYVGSLRKQGLILCILAVLSFDPAFNLLTYPYLTSSVDLTFFLMSISLAIFALIAPFTSWISTFGEHDGKRTTNDGWFRPLRMFQPVASGALPFILFWFALTCIIPIVLLKPWQAKVQPYWKELLIWVAYLALLLTFLWAIGRFWSALIGKLTPARWLSLFTFGVLFYLTGISMLSPIYPFIWLSTEGLGSRQALVFFWKVITYGAVISILTLILFILSQILSIRRSLVGGRK